MDDHDYDGRWMTYAELADARGIDRQSARRMANRTRWRRQKDNHGVVRVYVPMAHVAAHRRQRDVAADISADMPAVMSADLSNAINALQGALASVEKRAESAEGRAERAEKLVELAESASSPR
jgi:hypothetical protein